MNLGEWQIYIANEVREWLDSLDAATHARVVQAIDTLAEQRYERYLKERTQEEGQR